MSEISLWSTIPNNNQMPTPIGWPEGQPPSSVNNCARQMMSAIRIQWNDAAWFNWGYNVLRVSGNSFTVTSATNSTVTLPAAFEPNARIKLFDSTTIYGTITTVSASAASTQVTFTPDAFSLTGSFSSVYNSIIPPTHTPIPGLNIPTDVVTQTTQQIYGVDTGTTNVAQITLVPTLSNYASGELIMFKALRTNTSSMTLQVDGLGNKTIKKNGGADNLTGGEIIAGQIASVVYDGTNFQLESNQATPAVPANVVLQTGAPIYAADAGSNDTYVITLSPAPAAYADGMVFNFKANTANTGAATLNVNSLGAITIKKNHDATLADGDIEAGQAVTVIYIGGEFQMQSQIANTGGGGTGVILQVVQATLTTTASSSSASFTDTGLTATITPSSATNKIMVVAFGNFASDIAVTTCGIRLVRGSTDLLVGTTPSNRIALTAIVSPVNNAVIIPVTISYLDSPATTSATTYKLQYAPIFAGAGTVYFNRTVNDTDSTNYARAASSIILMEVSA